MSLLAKTQELCRLYRINPSRTKGQNFLVNEAVYDKMVASAELKASDRVLEVGPGLGFLTTRLAKASGQVVAVELDDKLADFLQTAISASEANNIKIINQDILKMQWPDFCFGGKESGINQEENLLPYKIVANLPYNISSFFLRKFLSIAWRPELMVLLLQKEVAERIVALPGDMSLLSVSVQYYAEAEIIAIVPPEDFFPAPQVQSAIIKIRPKDTATLLSPKDEDAFFRLLKFGFSAKRKMLKNNLAAGLACDAKVLAEALLALGFNPKTRAEDLSLNDWRRLFGALKAFML